MHLDLVIRDATPEEIQAISAIMSVKKPAAELSMMPKEERTPVKGPVEKKIDARKKNRIPEGNRWTPEEEALLFRYFGKPDLAIAAYRAAFPDSRRTDSGIRQRLMILQRRKPPAKTLQEKALPAGDGKIEIIGGEGLAGALPDKRDPSVTEGKNTLRLGDTVRQVAGSPLVSGVGVVKRTPADRPDEALVEFSNGVEWVKKSNLALVTS